MKETHKGVAAVIGLLLIVPAMVIQAHAFRMLWGWFVVPATGLQPLKTGVAAGLIITAGFFRAMKKPNEDENALDRLAWWINGAIVAPLFIWGCGWLVWKLWC